MLISSQILMKSTSVLWIVLVSRHICSASCTLARIIYVQPQNTQWVHHAHQNHQIQCKCVQSKNKCQTGTLKYFFQQQHHLGTN